MTSRPDPDPPDPSREARPLPAGAQLEQGELLARTQLDTIDARTFLLEEDGTIVDVNEAAARARGITRESLIGTCVYDHVSEPFARTRREAVARALRDMSPVRIVDDPDGRTIEATYHPLSRGPDAPRRVVVVAHDVTARTRAERTLEGDARRLRDVVEHLPDAYLQTDASGRVMMANPAAARMFGYGAPEALVGADVARLWVDVERRVAMHGEIWSGPGRFTDWIENGVRVDGSTFWGSINGTALCDEAGRLVGMAWVVRDVTERRRFREQLQQSEAQLRAILDNLQDAYLQVDPAGRIARFSPSAIGMWGYSAEELKGLPARSLYAEPDGRAEFLRELRRSGRVADWVVLERRKDGSSFWVSATAYLRRNEEGQEIVEVMVRDISERKRAEAEHLRVQATLAQSDRLASMGMLAAGVAHEINNPLSYVLYNLESLAADLPRLEKAHRARSGRARGGKRRRSRASADDPWADVGDRFRNALEGTRKIRDIARGLRTFSRVEKERIQPVDLRLPIESALAVAYNEIKYRARLDKDLGATTPVLASEGKLSQVFLNLFINAAQAIEEGNVERNRILVRTRQDGARVRIEVLDTGSGIAAEHLQRIFDPFFTTKAIGVGSGLGLSIVRNIVQGFGGTIEVTSEPGKGTRFVVVLPAATDDQEPAPEVRSVHASRTAVRGRLLVVDDEAPVRYALKRLLRAHDVVEAESGEDACGIVEDAPRFDVILCDMMMPRMTGVDFHRWLLANHPALARRVLFVTGGAFTPVASDYLQQVENLRVEKPFDSENLPKLVAELVRAARAERRSRR
jgi:PAS domain S-box-containing protein